MNTYLKFLLFVTAAALTAVAGAAEKPKVLASIRPLQLVVDDLAGEWIESEVLIDGAGSPHHFALRISDRQKIKQADLVVWVGPELERFLDGVLEKKNTVTFTGLEQLSWPAEQGSAEQDSHHAHSGVEPHVWLSLHNVAVFAEAVVGQLAEVRPDLAERLGANLKDFKARLTDLHTEAKTALENAGGTFAVYHDGFRHFSQTYHLNQAAAVTLVPEEQISARRLAQLKEELRQAKCLIVDTSELHTAERYARVLELPLVQVDLLAVDSSIASYAEFYQSLVRGFNACLSGKP